MQRRSTIAFLMRLPLIILIATLVAYPAGYAVYLAMLNKGMTRFVGLGNFEFLFGRDTFWMVVYRCPRHGLAAACRAFDNFFRVGLSGRSAPSSRFKRPARLLPACSTDCKVVG
jgi:hypothetical protein